MSLTISHLEGPLAGQEQHFDDSVPVIVFGRSPECQVVYPPDYSIVGRMHVLLRRTMSGDYAIELLAERYVEIDGIQADNGSVVTAGSVIRLGRNGPSFMLAFDGIARFTRPPASQGEIADIAWSSAEADPDAGDFLSRYPIEQQWEGVVDLLVRRKSEALAVTAGIPAAALATAVADSKISSGGPLRSPVEAEIKMSAALRRSGSALWWTAAAAALGAAVIAYLLLRRQIVLGPAFGKLFSAAVLPPPAPKATRADLVDVSVFGPTAIEAGGEGLIQVFLHKLSQREIAKALAQETDPDAMRRGLQTLAAEIAFGQQVQIILEGRGLSVDQEMQSLVWRGEPCACQFTVSAPKDLAGRSFHPRVIVLVNSVPVGSLTFALKITAEEAEAGSGLRGDRARRYTYAFLSYASPDRNEVIKRAQGLKAGGTNFFNDLLSLEPGERWERRLYEEIDRCDVFYLFWSSQAKQSEWVMKETEYALARRTRSEHGNPDIIPVIIEGPPPPAPPDSLKEIHFNDSLLYVLAGVQGGPPVTGN